MRLVFVILTLMFSVLSTPILAEKYECKMRMRGSSGNWVGPTVYVDYDKNNDHATLIDGMIKFHAGRPIKAYSIVENNKRITFRYRVESVKGRSPDEMGAAYVNFVGSFTILKSGLGARATMIPLGYNNTFYDEGSCLKR